MQCCFEFLPGYCLTNILVWLSIRAPPITSFIGNIRRQNTRRMRTQYYCLLCARGNGNVTETVILPRLPRSSQLSLPKMSHTVTVGKCHSLCACDVTRSLRPWRRTGIRRSSTPSYSYKIIILAIIQLQALVATSRFPPLPHSMNRHHNTRRHHSTRQRHQ